MEIGLEAMLCEIFCLKSSVKKSGKLHKKITKWRTAITEAALNIIIKLKIFIDLNPVASSCNEELKAIETSTGAVWSRVMSLTSELSGGTCSSITGTEAKRSTVFALGTRQGGIVTQLKQLYVVIPYWTQDIYIKKHLQNQLQDHVKDPSDQASLRNMLSLSLWMLSSYESL